jgi:hypothetical protein
MSISDYTELISRRLDWFGNPNSQLSQNNDLEWLVNLMMQQSLLLFVDG